MNEGKVICIGMHKTGTTTLGLALLDLGYSVMGARIDLAPDLLDGKIDVVINVATPYEALQDVPWALLYKELDEKFPNSKFILTERDENKWINSVVNHFGSRYIQLHDWIYGKGEAIGNEELYINKYKKHNKEVRAYFKDRPGDLLTISFAKGDGWKEICNFLELEVPKKKFPFVNKGKHNLSFSEKLYNSLRSSIPTPIRRKVLNMLGFPDNRNRFNNHNEHKVFKEKTKK